MATLQVELVAVERKIWSGEATMVIDGRSVCDDHGRPMIKVIAGRMIRDEPSDDAGQG